MYRYAFFLGRELQVSAAEIRAVFFGNPDIKMQGTNTHLFVETPKTLSAQTLMQRLGGTVKIAQQIPVTEPAAESMATYLESTAQDTKIHFSLGGNCPKGLAMAIKKILKERGRSVRYIEPKNSATILHNHLVERQSDLTYIGKEVYATVALQPFEEFGERDFGRPGRDSRSGMLPPKLARILINLSGTTKEHTLLDPFCGSGTILGEAILLGYIHLIGNDLSPKAITDTETNLAWMQKNLSQPPVHPQLLCNDAATLDSKLPKQSVDAIVTEPYLGKPLTGKESASFLRTQAQELEALYEHSFVSFSRILKPGGIIIFIFPSFHTNDLWFPTVPVEKIKRLGFVTEALGTTEPWIRYMRPGQHLARDIWKWRKK